MTLNCSASPIEMTSDSSCLASSSTISVVLPPYLSTSPRQCATPFERSEISILCASRSASSSRIRAVFCSSKLPAWFVASSALYVSYHLV